MKPPRVTAIITTRNEEENIRYCLDSIKSQTYKNIEIIVVDNGSSDGTKHIARRYTKLVFDKGPERSAQRNFGASKATGTFVLFLDADMILESGVVDDCVKCMLQKPGMFGGIIIPEVSFGIGYWAKVKAYERSFYVGDDSIEAARFFDRAIFLGSGGFDESMTGPEDWDLSDRIRKNHGIGRIASYIRHNEGTVTLGRLMRKKFYYAHKVSLYLKKSNKSIISNRTIYFFRPAFFRSWNKLLNNPVLTSSMIIMLFMEMLAGGIGYLLGRNNTC